MKRTPIYHKQNSDYRVVYRPKQSWVAQFNTRTEATREHDPWQDLGPPQATQDDAIKIMHNRCPLKLKP